MTDEWHRIEYYARLISINLRPGEKLNLLWKGKKTRNSDDRSSETCDKYRPFRASPR